MKWLDAFLEFKNEDAGTKRLTLLALLIITVSLASLSISGAFANSKGDWLAFIPRFGYASLVLGLESLAAVILVRALLAADWRRAAVCFVLFAGLAWANVQNAKDGVHYIFPDRFGEDSQTLNEKADLAHKQAGKIEIAAGAAIASIPDQLKDARAKLSALEAEQKMLSSPARVKESQQDLQSLGRYTGNIDGIYRDLTKEAMLSRGSEISADMEVLKNTITGLQTGSSVTTTATASGDKDTLEIETRAKSRAAFWAELRLEVILWISECARSMGLWAAVTSITASLTNRERQRAEELAEAEHQAKLAELRGEKKIEPEQEAEPEPANDAPGEPEDTAQQAWSRKGGRSAQHARKAAKDPVKVPVGDWRHRDELFEDAA